jgi:EAL domain-containing protein (putative c-di-GMP-specific phosphodiesterase class I)
VFAQEALVRGAGHMGAGHVLSLITPGNRCAFDQDSRRVAIHLAARLGLSAVGERTLLSINVQLIAGHDPDRSLEPVLVAADAVGLSPDRILFEFTEAEAIDPGRLQAMLRSFQANGFRTAIDDFGAGRSGLNLLARFQPDLLKLDMGLVRSIDLDHIKRTLVSHMVALARDIGVQVVAEGVETPGEYKILSELGVSLLQGYLFARPAFEAFAEPYWPDRSLPSANAA